MEADPALRVRNTTLSEALRGAVDCVERDGRLRSFRPYGRGVILSVALLRGRALYYPPGKGVEQVPGRRSGRPRHAPRGRRRSRLRLVGRRQQAAENKGDEGRDGLSFGYYDDADGRFTAQIDILGLGTEDAVLVTDAAGSRLLATNPDITCEIPFVCWCLEDLLPLLEEHGFMPMEGVENGDENHSR
jgi:hypothetical protein